MIINSEDYYNSSAENYRDLLLKRKNYLLSIESEIIKLKSVDKYLDIASGEGTRSYRIINSLKPSYSLLIDESEKMLQKSIFLFKNSSVSNVDFLKIDFLKFKPEVKFQLITCLWNVFGHIPNKELRLDFLKNIYLSLENKGVVFIDINNRYNYRHYGIFNVVKNMFGDLFKIKKVGYFELNVTDNVKSYVYVHNPFEFDELIKKAGFKILEKKYFDYTKGVEVENYFEGQILYKLVK